MTDHENTPASVAAPTGAENDTITDQMRSSSLTTIDPKAACRHCTVPVESGDVCSWCASYTPPAACTGDVWCGCTCHACTVTFEHCGTGPLVVDGLLADADLHLADELEPAITARMAHASTAFPVAGWSCYVTDVDGNRITISATRRDPETRQHINREFVAELREVV